MLTESYEYFSKSYEIWNDERTKHNKNILEKLLQQGDQKTEELKNAERENSPTASEEASELWESEENSQETSTSWENDSPNTSEGNWENWQEAAIWAWTPSPAIFQDLGYNSEEELLSELERYTTQMQERSSQYRPYIGEQFTENISPFDDIFSEFFSGRWGIFWELPSQSEKDW